MHARPHARDAPCVQEAEAGASGDSQHLTGGVLGQDTEEGVRGVLALSGGSAPCVRLCLLSLLGLLLLPPPPLGLLPLIGHKRLVFTPSMHPEI